MSMYSTAAPSTSGAFQSYPVTKPRKHLSALATCFRPPLYDRLDSSAQSPEDYQIDDLEELIKGERSAAQDLMDVEELVERNANWSEMGAKKTSTALWLIQRRCKMLGIKNPNVLVITTRGGKGTYFDLGPKLLPGWTVFNVQTQSIGVFVNGKEIKLPKIKHVPDKFDMPALVITHYAVFSKSNSGKALTDEHGEPVLDPDTGSVVMVEGTQADKIVKRQWDFVILDEAHRIKDKDAKWTVVIKRIKCKNRHIMTGTGFINRPDEIWSELNFLNKHAFPGYNDFKDEFCEIDSWSGYSVIKGVKPEKKDEFRALVRALGPRRTLDEVMPNIKKAVTVELEVDLNPTQRKMNDEIKTELRTLDQQGYPITASNVLVLLQRLRAIAVATPQVVSDYYDPVQERRVQKVKLVEPSSKLDCVMDEVLAGLSWDEDARQPVVIFSNFVGPLELLSRRFEKANRNALEMGLDPEFPYIWMKDSDSDEQRYNKWHDLFPTMQYRVFMSTLQLGGESINLTPARHVVFLDRSWSPKDNLQGVGRIRRPGQTGEPVVININAKDTSDQRVEYVNYVKNGWFQQIFGDE